MSLFSNKGKLLMCTLIEKWNSMAFSVCGSPMHSHAWCQVCSAVCGAVEGGVGESCCCVVAPWSVQCVLLEEEVHDFCWCGCWACCGVCPCVSGTRSDTASLSAWGGVLTCRISWLTWDCAGHCHTVFDVKYYLLIACCFQIVTAQYPALLEILLSCCPTSLTELKIWAKLCWHWSSQGENTTGQKVNSIFIVCVLGICVLEGQIKWNADFVSIVSQVEHPWILESTSRRNTVVKGTKSSNMRDRHILAEKQSCAIERFIFIMWEKQGFLFRDGDGIQNKWAERLQILFH